MSKKWMVEVGQNQTTIESKHYTVAVDVTNEDAELIAAAPELLDALRRIFASAPIRGLPLGLALDISNAAAILHKLKDFRLRE